MISFTAFSSRINIQERNMLFEERQREKNVPDASNCFHSTSVAGYFFAISSAQVCKFSPAKSDMITAFAPLIANAAAAARPIPRSELHPVMMATLSFKRAVSSVEA